MTEVLPHSMPAHRNRNTDSVHAQRLMSSVRVVLLLLLSSTNGCSRNDLCEQHQPLFTTHKNPAPQQEPERKNVPLPEEKPAPDAVPQTHTSASLSPLAAIPAQLPMDVRLPLALAESDRAHEEWMQKRANAEALAAAERQKHDAEVALSRARLEAGAANRRASEVQTRREFAERSQKLQRMLEESSALVQKLQQR